MSYSKPDKQLAIIQFAIDVVIFTIQDGQLKVLLINRHQEPFINLQALPGGFMWEDETALETAARILANKAGVEADFLEQLFTFDAPERDPRGRVISISHFALVPDSRLSINSASSTEKPQLVPVQALPLLAFDHNDIISTATTRLRSKLAYTNAAYSLLPAAFTLSQLQGVYEVIFGSPIDKRNFRKKYLTLGLIEPTDQRVTGARFRPAQLYRFTSTEPTELPSPAFSTQE